MPGDLRTDSAQPQEQGQDVSGKWYSAAYNWPIIRYMLLVIFYTVAKMATLVWLLALGALRTTIWCVLVLVTELRTHLLHGWQKVSSLGHTLKVETQERRDTSENDRDVSPRAIVEDSAPTPKVTEPQLDQLMIGETKEEEDSPRPVPFPTLEVEDMPPPAREGEVPPSLQLKGDEIQEHQLPTPPAEPLSLGGVLDTTWQEQQEPQLQPEFTTGDLAGSDSEWLSVDAGDTDFSHDKSRSLIPSALRKRMQQKRRQKTKGANNRSPPAFARPPSISSTIGQPGSRISIFNRTLSRKGLDDGSPRHSRASFLSTKSAFGQPKERSRRNSKDTIVQNKALLMRIVQEMGIAEAEAYLKAGDRQMRSQIRSESDADSDSS